MSSSTPWLFFLTKTTEEGHGAGQSRRALPFLQRPMQGTLRTGVCFTGQKRIGV
ncbi:hypothetical protein [Eubacterium callanderi]|uniref:hypothetical protein n=1 Tax=Eubacterium callanderi TaxID=53442 RepID=UPI0013562978|nr:hypothetical protein [Eubacterium callanderi]MCQ5188217.1 hypothetical protein [Eubacterium callanderi]